jgi:hypothetical protein
VICWITCRRLASPPGQKSFQTRRSGSAIHLSASVLLLGTATSSFSQLLRLYAPTGGSLDRSEGCFPAVMMSARSYDR